MHTYIHTGGGIRNIWSDNVIGFDYHTYHGIIEYAVLGLSNGRVVAANLIK